MKSYKSSLDFWRIVFTYLIVALHYGYSVGWKLGVEFFFILSGMLLAAECNIKKTGFKQYVWKRIRRLYPHYIFSFFVFVLILDNGGGHCRVNTGNSEVNAGNMYAADSWNW